MTDNISIRGKEDPIKVSSESSNIFQENLFYREHDDLSSRTKLAKVRTHTEAGLALYFFRRQKTEDGKKFLENAELVMDYDFYIDQKEGRPNTPQREVPIIAPISRQSSEDYMSVDSRSSSPSSRELDEVENVDELCSKIGCNFTDEMVKEIKRKISIKLELGQRKTFIIHRDGHTVTLIKEGGGEQPDKFLLVDSYNAYGAKDKDHLPLLKIIREACPMAKIYTLHDKIQSDYYSCRIFSVESAIEIERYCQNHACGLEKVMQTNSATYYGYDDKEKFYSALRVEAVPVPLPIVPFIQSYKVIDSMIGDAAKAGKEFLMEKREGEQTYAQFLEENLHKTEKDGSIKKQNRTIENKYSATRKELTEFLQRVTGGYGKENHGEFVSQTDKTVARTFVSQLYLMRELEQKAETIKQ